MKKIAPTLLSSLAAVFALSIIVFCQPISYQADLIDLLNLELENQESIDLFQQIVTVKAKV